MVNCRNYREGLLGLNSQRVWRNLLLLFLRRMPQLRKHGISSMYQTLHGKWDLAISENFLLPAITQCRPGWFLTAHQEDLRGMDLFPSPQRRKPRLLYRHWMGRWLEFFYLWIVFVIKASLYLIDIILKTIVSIR